MMDYGGGDNIMKMEARVSWWDGGHDDVVVHRWCICVCKD